MKKKFFILLLVFVIVFSFALTTFAKSGAFVDLEDNKLYVPAPAKQKTPDHTPPANNPIDVAGA